MPDIKVDFSKMSGGVKRMWLQDQGNQALIRAYCKKNGVTATVFHFHMKLETFRRYFPDLYDDKKPKTKPPSETDILRDSLHRTRRDVEVLGDRCRQLEDDMFDMKNNWCDMVADSFSQNVLAPLLKKMMGVSQSESGSGED